MAYSLDMSHVPGAAHVITWPAILTEVATVLAANSPARVDVLNVLKAGLSIHQVGWGTPADIPHPPMSQRKLLITNSVYQQIRHHLHHAALSGWANNLSLLKPQLDVELDGALGQNNSSSPTMTTKDLEFLSACKQEISVKEPPLNTITKEAYQELLRSTRTKRKSEAAKKKVTVNTAVWPSVATAMGQNWFQIQGTTNQW